MNLHRKPIKPLILIAEDDPDDRLLLKMTFNEEGCELRFVEDGVELMNYLHGNACIPMPSLILLDLRMPRKDGKEALLEIRKHEKLKHIPIVVWTTSNADKDQLFCAEAGASEYFTKPSAFVEMDAAIKDIVKRWLPLPFIAEEVTKGRAITQCS